MTKQEKHIILNQIESLQKRKAELVDDLVSRCEEINYQIKYLRKQIKEQK